VVVTVLASVATRAMARVSHRRMRSCAHLRARSHELRGASRRPMPENACDRGYAPRSPTREAVEQLSRLSTKPAGPVRLLVSRLAAKIVLASKLGQFARDYPCSGKPDTVWTAP
jgi:hypothetical protein